MGGVLLGGWGFGGRGGVVVGIGLVFLFNDCLIVFIRGYLIK